MMQERITVLVDAPAMRNSSRKSLVLLTIGCLMVIGSFVFVPPVSAEMSNTAVVPEPQIIENHIHNMPGVQGNVTTYFRNDEWSLNIAHGDVNTLLMARNITQGSQTWVDYTFNIQYNIGNTTYIAQFMLDRAVFTVGGQVVSASLKTCDGFELVHSPVKYDGTIPTLDCNITYKGIRVYQEGYANSTFDLTLIHHFRGDWNQTDIKVEAVFDFPNTRFYQANGTEFSAGEPFTAEIQYKMLMTNPITMVTDGPIIPTGHSNTTLEYNLTLSNGMPLTMSKLDMKNTFAIINATGSHASTGYSTMVYGPFTQVTHGFPDLAYKDTQSIRSDPEITVYHNRVSAKTMSPSNNGPPDMLISIIVLGAITAVGAVFILRRKKKRAKE